jgi:hypothetical protein
MVWFHQALCLIDLKGPDMQTLDTMRSLGLLTREQYLEITAYVIVHSTPEQIAAMPAHLWQAVLHADALLYPGGEAEPVH